MITNSPARRAEWAARVHQQAEQMLVLAGFASDDAMRNELLGFARRLRRHAAEIVAAE